RSLEDRRVFLRARPRSNVRRLVRLLFQPFGSFRQQRQNQAWTRGQDQTNQGGSTPAPRRKPVEHSCGISATSSRREMSPGFGRPNGSHTSGPEASSALPRAASLLSPAFGSPSVMVGNGQSSPMSI